MMDKQRHLVGIEYEVVLECQLRKLGTFVCVFVCVCGCFIFLTHLQTKYRITHMTYNMSLLFH